MAGQVEQIVSRFFCKVGPVVKVKMYKDEQGNQKVQQPFELPASAACSVSIAAACEMSIAAACEMSIAAAGCSAAARRVMHWLCTNMTIQSLRLSTYSMERNFAPVSSEFAAERVVGGC